MTAMMKILAFCLSYVAVWVRILMPGCARAIAAENRRKLLDQVLFWTSNDLENKLEAFRQYYNDERGHCGVGKISPTEKAGKGGDVVVSLDNYRWKKHCRGLFELPMTA